MNKTNTMECFDIIKDVFYEPDVLPLMNVLSFDSCSFFHSLNVARTSVQMGVQMELPYDELTMLSRAALLHDIGKIFTPYSVLMKPGQLTEQEYKAMQSHVILGANYLASTHKFSERLMRIIRQHHENYDGSGYPDQLAGENIDLLARIIRIADTYDAMHSERIYKLPIAARDIYKTLLNDNGKLYDKNLIPYLEEQIPYLKEFTKCKKG